MYNPTTIHECLDTLVSLDDASKWSTQYLNTTVLTKAFPANDILDESIAAVLKGSVDKLMYQVYVKKIAGENVKSVLADFMLFDGRADFNNKNANTGRFVGLRFIPKVNNDLSITITKVSFQIDMVCPGLKLYLFSGDQPEPLKTIDCPYQQSRGVQWFALSEPLILSGNSDYYLGYFEADLGSGQSIKKTIDYVNGSACTSCNHSSMTNTFYQTRSKYVDMQPFYVENPTDRELPDMDDAIEVNQNNFGMNIQASINCDISDFICRNSGLIREPLSLQLAIDLLTVIQTSERDNSHLEKAKQLISYLLNGDKDAGHYGLFYKLDKMIDALTFDLSGINSVCLACTKRPGMKYRGLGV